MDQAKTQVPVHVTVTSHIERVYLVLWYIRNKVYWIPPEKKFCWNIQNKMCETHL